MEIKQRATELERGSETAFGNTDDRIPCQK